MRTTSCMMNSDDNILSMYLKDINKIPLLSREEEIELATRAAQGDKVAKDKIVQANLRFVVNVAKKYQNHGIDLLDLISEGNIGLITAIDRFDVTKGYHFISYAVWWIRQSILKAICEKSRMIRLPLNRANELVQIEQARKAVAGGTGEEEEMTQDTPIGTSEESSVTIGDNTEDFRYQSPEEAAMETVMQDELEDVLSSLPQKEAQVLRYRFGLNGNKSMSLKEVGDKFNLTKERIRQIEKKAIRRLQTPATMDRLSAFVA